MMLMRPRAAVVAGGAEGQLHVGSATAVQSNTHTVSLPSGIVSGDLLVVFFKLPPTGSDDRKAAVPSGWTLTRELLSFGTIFQCFTRIADGTEGSSVTLTLGGGHVAYSASNAWRLAGGYTVAGSAGNVSSNDPPNLSLGASAETLWIATLGAQKCDWDATAGPAGYGPAVSAASLPGGADTSHVRAVSAHKVSTAASEDPGLFTYNEFSPYNGQVMTVAFRK